MSNGLAILHNGVFIARLASVANYVFWLGAMSVLGLCLIPFGFHWPARALFATAFGAGVIQLAANFFDYEALEAGEASQTLAIMGGFSPLATYLIAIAGAAVVAAGSVGIVNTAWVENYPTNARHECRASNGWARWFYGLEEVGCEPASKSLRKDRR